MSLSDDDILVTNEITVSFISNNKSCDKRHDPYTTSDKPSSEIALERSIVVIFNQDINGSISTFFTTTYNRRNISDITNPDLIDYKNPLHFQLKSSNLNQSERDLIATLFLCNR